MKPQLFLLLTTITHLLATAFLAVLSIIVSITFIGLVAFCGFSYFLWAQIYMKQLRGRYDEEDYLDI